MKILFFSLLPVGDLSRELIGFFLDEAGIDDENATVWPTLEPSVDAPNPPKPSDFLFVVVMGEVAWDRMTKGKIPFEHGKITKRNSRYYVSVTMPSELIHAGNTDRFLDVAKDIRKIIEEEML